MEQTYPGNRSKLERDHAPREQWGTNCYCVTEQTSLCASCAVNHSLQFIISDRLQPHVKMFYRLDGVFSLLQNLNSVPISLNFDKGHGNHGVSALENSKTISTGDFTVCQNCKTLTEILLEYWARSCKKRPKQLSNFLQDSYQYIKLKISVLLFQLAKFGTYDSSWMDLKF